MMVRYIDNRKASMNVPVSSEERCKSVTARISDQHYAKWLDLKENFRIAHRHPSHSDLVEQGIDLLHAQTFNPDKSCSAQSTREAIKCWLAGALSELDKK